MKILLATTSKKKLEEYQHLLTDSNIEFITLNDLDCHIEAPEDQDTFTGNALQKAQFYYDMFHMPVISDDSGIEVLQLNNFPGVQSKRWLEQETYAHKIETLLTMLKGKDSSCQYQAAIAYVDGKTTKVFTGTFPGKLVAPDINNHHAFGYDIGFYIKTEKALLSDLPLSYKNKVSHRAQALQAFVKWIKTSELK